MRKRKLGGNFMPMAGKGELGRKSEGWPVFVLEWWIAKRSQ